MQWQAPENHSRKDWIGIYRVRSFFLSQRSPCTPHSFSFADLHSMYASKQVGANQSSLVTKTSSLGMWLPVHDEEWDGDVPIGIVEGGAKDTPTSGEVVFKGDKLPWGVGRYEVRCSPSSQITWALNGQWSGLCVDRFGTTMMGSIMS